ncbi:MAG: hypothetical protein KDA88_02885 [Planctomycetaceae bacterium]|nr:hypothetical protein [Planctomycetaceae bacterium]MCB9951148.1 hypothetical protein [Planctomycetaceae bacterium]
MKLLFNSRLLSLLLLAFAGVSGCALLIPDSNREKHNPLPPIVGPRDAMELEVFIVDRAVGDPLIGDGLWDSLHEVTSITPDLKERLEEQGLRVAMSPSRPPRSVQALLALSGGDDPTRRTIYHRVVVPASQPALIPITTLASPIEVALPAEHGTKVKELTQGVCQLRIQLDKVTEGWASLEVQPVIQHGADMLRPKATAEEWLFEQGQQTIMLYDHRFNVELNRGELIALGMTGESGNSVGARFFHGEWNGVPIERHVFLRLRGMHRIAPVRAQ